ncbi:Kinase D-interacting substrate [Liparis tanakae]|uniref:Kinase D-interacting substrate n=1 Tax=Liparis tanakae TaxID=230148 RepID=A0A4Z2ETM7_9TELE|nr:Kinase D-interacting substrate [Liparis tanakae]
MASTCPSHLHPRPPPTGCFSRDATAGPASVASVAPPLLLSAMTTEAVCERVQQIDGIDQSVAAQYGATIRKANVNGRVLSQCDIDELKREMSMNFGDWQLFRATVLDLRLLESQVLQEEAASEQGSVGGGASEVGRRAPAPMYSFNMSFEELSTLGGLEDAPRTGWMGGAHRTVSMSSLTSQASSNDIARLTERQQDEYRSAYQEYAAQMSQVETGGGERPVQPTPGQFMTAPPEDQSRDGGEPDGRKSFAKRSGKPAPDSADSASGADALDPITEEDEKGDHGAARAPPPRQALFPAAAAPEPEAGGGGGLGLGGGGLRYQKLTSDDEESEESDNAPLLKDATPPGARRPAAGSLALKGKDFLSDATLDKKDSSDSGVRSNESSPDRSLQDEEAELSRPERDDLIELDEDHAKRRLPRSLGGPREAAPARMSVGSEDGWPAAFNLNRTASSVALHNHANNRPRPPEGGPASSADPASSSGDVILSPSSASSARPGPDNENVRVVHLKRGLRPGDPPEVCSMSSDTVTFGEERESIL